MNKPPAPQPANGNSGGLVPLDDFADGASYITARSGDPGNGPRLHETHQGCNRTGLQHGVRIQEVNVVGRAVCTNLAERSLRAGTRKVKRATTARRCGNPAGTWQRPFGGQRKASV